MTVGEVRLIELATDLALVDAEITLVVDVCLVSTNVRVGCTFVELSVVDYVRVVLDA